MKRIRPLLMKVKVRMRKCKKWEQLPVSLLVHDCMVCIIEFLKCIERRRKEVTIEDSDSELDTSPKRVTKSKYSYSRKAEMSKY